MIIRPKNSFVRETNASEKTKLVADIFGLSKSLCCSEYMLDEIEIPEGKLVFVTGPSGSGKSTILRSVRQALQIQDQYPATYEKMLTSDLAVIDFFDVSTDEAIRWLAKFGLGEPRIMTLPLRFLSDGQKHRAVVARLLQEPDNYIVVDEFLSLLDRKSAAVVAWNVQKQCRRSKPKGVFLAAANDDIIDYLQPDLVVRCELDGRVRLESPNQSPSLNSKMPFEDRLTIEAGSLSDYLSLAKFHYSEEESNIRSGDDPRISALHSLCREVRVARIDGEIAAVAVYGLPWPRAFEKVGILARENQKILVSLRVVVHPIFRGIGLTQRLSPTESDCEVIFSYSALGRYFPFRLGAGFTSVDHPWNIRTPDHDALEELLSLTSVPEGSVRIVRNRPDIAMLERVIANHKRRDVIVALSRKIVLKANVDHAVFLAELVNERPTSRDRAFLNAFFESVLVRTAGRCTANLVFTALFYPVQAFCYYRR